MAKAGVTVVTLNKQKEEEVQGLVVKISLHWVIIR